MGPLYKAMPRSYRDVSRRLLCRYLQLWFPPEPPAPLSDPITTAKVTKVTRGVGFTVFYTPSTPSLWFWGEYPPISGGEQGNLESISLPRRQLVEQVAVGRRHVVAMTTNGEVFSMGLNNFGQCGRPAPSPSNIDQLLPLELIKPLEPISKVCCGLDHTHFLSTAGRLFSCGWSDDGQTGTGCHGAVATPTEVIGDVRAERVRDIDSTADSTLAITETHSVYAWGNNEYEQLAIPSDDMQVFTPWRVISPPDQSDDNPVVAVTIGSTFSAVLTQRGSVWYVGRLGGSGAGEWRMLHDRDRHGGKVVDIGAGLHYLAAVCVEGERCHMLLWGHHHQATSTPISLPDQIEVPSALVDWDAGPLEPCLLLE